MKAVIPKSQTTNNRSPPYQFISIQSPSPKIAENQNVEFAL